MAIEHTLSFGWQSGSGTPLSASVVVSSEGEDNREVTVPLATNDVEVAIAFVLASLKSIYILSDKDVTLETNSASAPDNTFALKANKPFVWYSDSGVLNPFLTNPVTKFFFSNAGAANATVKIKCLKDSTP